MSWAKLDDRFHSHPKVIKAWQRNPVAIGLHVICMSWASSHETDGQVPPELVSQLVPDAEQRARVLEALNEAGLWEPNGEGWLIHDYLDYNPSRAEAESKRKADRERKEVQKDSKKNPPGIRKDSSRPRDGSGTGRDGSGSGGSSRRTTTASSRARVDGKPVTDAELELAGQVLAAFNDVASSEFTLDAHLTPLVMRIRRHPDLTVQEHRRIIAANFASPWWKDRPGPEVIYGNSAAFERARDRAKGGIRTAEHPADRKVREIRERRAARSIEGSAEEVAA